MRNLKLFMFKYTRHISLNQRSEEDFHATQLQPCIDWAWNENLCCVVQKHFNMPSLKLGIHDFIGHFAGELRKLNCTYLLLSLVDN